MKKRFVVILLTFIIILGVNSVSSAADEDYPRVCEYGDDV